MKLSIALRLSAQSATILDGYGMEVMSDEEATDLYLPELERPRNKVAFIQSLPRGSERQKTMGDSLPEFGGGFLPAASLL